MNNKEHIFSPVSAVFAMAAASYAALVMTITNHKIDGNQGMSLPIVRWNLSPTAPG
jgi:hypothetical protein